MSQETINNAVAFQTRPTPSQQKLAQALSGKNVTIEEAVPADISKKDFDSTLDAVCSTMARAQIVEDGMFIALGRLMVVAQENPELWKEKFETQDKMIFWIEQKYGVCRATVFEARRLASRWSGVITAEMFEAVGRVKLGLIGKVIDIGKEGSAQANKFLTMATEKTTAEMRSYFEEKGMIGASEATGTYFTFPCNKRQAKDFKKFFNDPRIQSHVGSGNLAEILDALISECEGEWLRQGEEKMVEENKGEKRMEAVQ